MKALPCLISLSVCVFLPLFSARGGDLGPLKQQFGQEMRQLQQMVRTGNVDFETRKNFDESVGATTWEFSRVLADAESVDWAHPSSERLKLSQQIAETIAPYNGLLSSVVFDASAPDSLRAESRNLLKYSQPDTPLLQILRGQIASGSLEQAAEAADLLFEYRSLTDDDKQVALQRSVEAADWGEREGWALELSRFGR